MLLTINGAALEIVSAVVSKNRVPIEARLSGIIPENRISRLKKRVGFEMFSIAEKNLCSSDFCASAAEKIFTETNIERQEIRAIIFVTQTADYFFPATSHLLQERLKLPRDIVAFDVNLGCSGFVYGLYIAASLAQNLPDGKILLLCGETPTRNIFDDDISGLSVFGDGGAAAVISKNINQKIYFNLQTFGELADGIIMPRGAYRNPLTELNVRENFAVMDGGRVIDFSTKYVPPNLRDLIKFAGVETDLFLMHQANRLILEALSEELNLLAENLPFRAEKIGNTSSASIPITLAEMARRGESLNELAVMSGFGVGMSIASAVVDLRNLICLPTGEI